MKHTLDQKFISLALNLSKINVGVTAPNPCVGCVIVKDGIIISTGVTGPAGKPHAEFIAINNCQKSLEGATLYVTLEPCSHFGKTDPCADLIIKSKIKKVVISTIDPDQRVNGKGIEKLKESGIEVVIGVMEEKAQEINRGFFTARKTGLPYVTLKLATSKDEKIADKDYKSKWITNEKSRQYTHHIRAKNDAILVGANTVRHDNPSLDCRILGLEGYSPKRIIVSNDLNLDPNYKIFQTAKKIPTYIATGDKNQDKCQAFTELGVQMIFCKQKNLNQLDLKDLLKKLCDLGVNSLMVEGGRSVSTKFINENLVDQLIWVRSNKIIGEDGITVIDFNKLKSLCDITNHQFGFKEVDERKFEDDIVTIYLKSQQNLDHLFLSISPN